MNSLPVKYYSQSKSWMDCKIFSDWFHQQFVPLVRKCCRDHEFEEKALLLLDNAPSHPSAEILQSDDGMIKTLFLPPNTTAAIQPMDQGVLDPCKRRYKRKLLAHIILENESEDKPVPDILKAINMKHVVYWIASAWEEASTDSLCKAWRKLLPETEVNDLEDEDTNLPGSDVEVAAQLGEDTQEAVAQWMVADINEPGHQVLNDDDIVAELLDGDDQDKEESSGEEDAAEETKVSPSDAFNALQVTLRWLEQTNADPSHLLLARKWRDKAARFRSQAMKQTSLRSYSKH